MVIPNSANISTLGVKRNIWRENWDKRWCCGLVVGALKRLRKVRKSLLMIPSLSYINHPLSHYLHYYFISPLFNIYLYAISSKHPTPPPPRHHKLDVSSLFLYQLLTFPLSLIVYLHTIILSIEKPPHSPPPTLSLRELVDGSSLLSHPIAHNPLYFSL